MDANEGTLPTPPSPLSPSPTPAAAPAPMPAPSTSGFAPPLPSISDFLRQVLALGRRSILPALPALVLLYCYRFGMGLYLVFAGDATSPLGFPDMAARAVVWVVTATAYLPLLVLVYTPFLPFQDALLRGTKRSFVDSVKHVLERLWPYGVSSFAQLLIIAIPATVVVFAAALTTTQFAVLPDRTRAALIVLAAFPAGLWVACAMFFLAFATPLLILEGRGPFASIRESVRLVRGHFGALFGRVFLFLVLLVLASVFASIPSAMLSVVTTVARQKIVGIEIAKVVWDSAVSTATFPFSVAALLILYRALVPASPEAGAEAAGAMDAGVVTLPIEGETTSATPPYRFE